jgi:hypothetical protein
MADWSDISDLWWLQPQRESGRALQGMALGAQMRQQRTQEDWRREQAQTLIDQRRAAMQTQEAKAKGIAAMSSYMSEVAARNAWTDPKARAGFYALGAQYPQAVDDPTMEAMGKNFESALARQAQAQRDAQTSAITELTAADTYENIARQLEGLGPLDEEMSTQVANLRQRATLLRGRQLSPTETIESLPGGGFKITRGPAGVKDAGAPTQAVLTETQKQALAGEAGVTAGVDLLNSLTESDVGARGFFNEYVVNRGIAQVFPELQENEVSSGRSLLRIFNERMKKSIKADAQLNEKEQQRLEQALPSLGLNESVGNAKNKIARFVEESRAVTRINAARTKVPVPDWAWTKEEIAQKFKANEIDEQKARDLLKRYHYNLTPAARAPAN